MVLVLERRPRLVVRLLLELGLPMANLLLVVPLLLLLLLRLLLVYFLVILRGTCVSSLEILVITRILLVLLMNLLV